MGKKIIIRDADFSVNAIDSNYVNITEQFVFVVGHILITNPGAFVNDGNTKYKATEQYVDISEYDNLVITGAVRTSASMECAVAFYDNSKVVLTAFVPTASEDGVEVRKYTRGSADFPQTAKYIRITYWSDSVIAENHYPEFNCNAL